MDMVRDTGRVPVVPGRDWHTAAACLTEDPELFFPEGTKGPSERQAAVAKSVCELCPVKAPCLEWALESGAEYGVWGGLDEVERRALKRRRARGTGTHRRGVKPAAAVVAA